MHDVFTSAQLGIEGNGRRVAIVRLDVDNPYSPVGGNHSEVVDQCCSDTAASVLSCYCQVVDIDLAPHPLELAEFIANYPADDVATVDGDQRMDVVLRKEIGDISLIRRFSGLALPIIEGITEHGIHLVEQDTVAWAQPANAK